jgi:hypothetical protein
MILACIPLHIGVILLFVLILFLLLSFFNVQGSQGHLRLLLFICFVLTILSAFLILFLLESGSMVACRYLKRLKPFKDCCVTNSSILIHYFHNMLSIIWLNQSTIILTYSCSYPFNCYFLIIVTLCSWIYHACYCYYYYSIITLCFRIHLVCFNYCFITILMQPIRLDSYHIYLNVLI